ncbi:hypothetical protein GCM10009836_25900 [Pseudonocardia ailaonensis]|uniref:histidine kinase n=2 Tax=Pseudonocardia ailaonensis TaxID=367279 RepID=A0ABN2MZI2_9PSEU
MTDRAPAPFSWARVHPDGRFVDGDRRLFDLATARRSVLVPSGGRHAWDSTPDRDLIWRIGPSGTHWLLEGFPDPGPVLTWTELQRTDAAHFLSVTGSTTMDGTVRDLAADFVEASGLADPLVILIDSTGDPTFAGGQSISHRALAAMERTRRNGAPMIIWEAFDERRMIIDPDWFAVARRDERFAPVGALLADGREGAYVAIPLAVGRRVIGVLSGIWTRSEQLDAARVVRWWTLADRLTLALRYSDANRRTRAHGAEAAWAKLRDDLHATVAQDVFVLSLEVARLTAGTGPVSPADMATTKTLTERLVSGIRAVIASPDEDTGDVGPAERLRELAEDVHFRSTAHVHFDREIDWDLLSSAFADDVVRIVAEAFRNALKHAHPTTITVSATLESSTRNLRLVVADDGRPPAATVPSGTGAGLDLLRRIIEERGGVLTLDVSSAGATLTVVVPAELKSEWAVAQQALDERSPEQSDTRQ